MFVIFYFQCAKALFCVQFFEALFPLSSTSENKISQKVLAKKLCISQTHLSNIENGRVGVTLLHLIKIKELFECPIEYFFEEKTLSENEAEKNECQKIKTIVEENNFRLEDLSKAIEIMKVLQKG